MYVILVIRRTDRHDEVILDFKLSPCSEYFILSFG